MAHSTLSASIFHPKGGVLPQKKLTIVAATAMTVLAFSLPSSANAQSQSERPRYGTTYEKPKPGNVTALTYPGELYGVKVLSRRKDANYDEKVALYTQLVMRAALLALENGREHFSFFGAGSARKTKEVVERGAAPSTARQYGRDSKGGTYSYDVEVPGSSSVRYTVRGNTQATAMVKIYTQEQVAADPDVSRGFEIDDAEAEYAKYLATVRGEWPSLISIYESLGHRSLIRMTQPGAVGADGRRSAVMAYSRLIKLYSKSGDEQRLQRASFKYKELVPK